MSNYSQTTFFTPKDTLPATDPNKTIFGAAYDVEFGNVATAISSKPDNLTVASFLNVNVTGNGLPANGIYLPSANALGFTSNTVLRATIATNGGLFMAGATGGSQGAGTINATGLFVNGVAVSTSGGTSGSFTITYTGITGSPTGTAFWNLVDNIVNLYLPINIGTSTATTFTATGLPAAIQPSRTVFMSTVYNCLTDNNIDAGTSVNLQIAFGTPSVITFFRNGGWTAAGNKGVNNNFAITYPIT